MGMGSAVSVMVGKNLGAGDFGSAKRNAKRLFGLGAALSLGCVAVGLVAAQCIGGIFPKLSPPQIPLAKHLIYVLLLFFPGNAIYGLCFFLLRAGGDTRRAMLLDSGYMWVLPVPVALVMGFFLADRMDVRLALFIVQFLLNLKIIWALRVVKRGTWLRNLTRVRD
jgi:Na+-driven multidrug efflux pump